MVRGAQPQRCPSGIKPAGLVLELMPETLELLVWFKKEELGHKDSLQKMIFCPGIIKLTRFGLFLVFINSVDTGSCS